MKDNILLRVFALCAIILVVIAAVAVYALQALNRSMAATDWVNHTHATISELDNITAQLRQADGLMRTYALTGEAADLAGSREAFEKMAQHFNTASALTRNEAATNQSLLQLRAQAADRETLAQAVWAARSANQSAKVQALLAADAGSAAVAAIERALGKLRDAQFEQLSERDHLSYVQAQTTRWVVGLGIGLNFLLLAGIGWLLYDDITARRRAATALTEANTQLESKVQARTAELQLSNAKLSAENLERKWTIASQEHQIRYNQLIVNSVSDLVFVLTKALNVTRINAAVVNLTGRLDEAILTSPLAAVVEVATEPATGFDPVALALREGRELRHHPAVVLGRNTRRIPARLTLIPLRDQDKVVGAVVVVQVAFTSAPDNSPTI